jgi:excisionase family DNA binding protein
MTHANHKTGAPPRVAYTVLELAEMLGISRTTAYALVGRGRVKCLRIGRKLLVSAAEVERFIERASQ